MRQVLAAKLALDGVEYDEFVLKNNLKNILRGRFRALRAQIPYKLPAMLESRLGLLGDAARDAVRRRRRGRRDHLLPVRRHARRRVSPGELERVLVAARAYDDETERILALARACAEGDAVRRMFIHLDRRSPPVGFAGSGRAWCRSSTTSRPRWCSTGTSVLTARQVIFVALEMLDSPEHEIPTLANSLQDLLRRGRLARTVALELAAEIDEAAAGAADRDGRRVAEGIAAAFRDRVRQLGGAPPLDSPEVNPRLDYVGAGRRGVSAPARRRRR